MTEQTERAEPMPTLPQTLVNIIGEYGMARTDGVSDIERLHRWTLLIAAIKLYAAECARAAVQQAQPVATITATAILQAVARGWCHEKNENKEMDADLALAIGAEVSALFDNAPVAVPPAPDGVAACGAGGWCNRADCQKCNPQASPATNAPRSITEPIVGMKGPEHG